MNKKWLIPLFGLSLLTAVVLSGVLLISHPSIWNPMHQNLMEKDFKERQKNSDKLIEILFKDAEKITEGLWNKTPYTEISRDLRLKRMNEKEIAHYEDVRRLLGTAKYATAACLIIALLGFVIVGWRKVWNASIASFLLLGFIAGVWMFIYWRGLFRALHWLIFQDDSWILDKTSYSIGLFPHKVWQTAGGVVAVYVFIILIAGVVLQALTKRYEKDGNKDSYRDS